MIMPIEFDPKNQKARKDLSLKLTEGKREDISEEEMQKILDQELEELDPVKPPPDLGREWMTLQRMERNNKEAVAVKVSASPLGVKLTPEQFFQNLDYIISQWEVKAEDIEAMGRSEESLRRARALFEEIIKGETSASRFWEKQVKDKKKKEERLPKELRRIAVLKEKLARLLAQK